MCLRPRVCACFAVAYRRRPPSGNAVRVRPPRALAGLAVVHSPRQRKTAGWLHPSARASNSTLRALAMSAEMSS
eukprot:3064455-Pleurochrysis_carterae.AAC.1